ncbi:MAG: response regulator [Thermoanaerobaculales bacterium]|jgi:CheY-like chemotaxis protein|nr:response regulator [Thermoanaerobaculales bacterium]
MSGTILLADDSLTIQKVVELTFAETDYHVVAVSSGDELLNRLRDSAPDVIICDVIMPGKDGYEVCQQIKSSSDWLHLPVILLTGTFEPFDRDRAIAAGCSEIITKPFEARKLVDTVERLVGSSDPQVPQVDDGIADGADQAWSGETAPIETPATQPSGDFGTQLSAAAAEDDGIEFTTTGFDEMEAAGQEPSTAFAETPTADGLEYQLDEPPAPEVPDLPAAPEPEPEVDVSAQTVRIDTSAMAEETAPQEEGWELPAPPEPIVPEPTAEPDAGPEPFAAPDNEPFADAAAIDDEPPAPAFQDEPSMADTSPVEPPTEGGPDEAEAAADTATGLSDADVDRIARRVVELASDRLEQIAWEVVPDMAEIVVRQRIRELEAETATAEPIQ